MGRITTGIGLVSGLNSKDIIDQLMQIESRKKDLVQARVDAIATQKTAYVDVSTRLTSLRISAQSLAKPSFFTNATASSSNENVLTASASRGAAVGSYQFQVARLVQAQQLIGRGFANPDKAPVGAGTLTIELGGGEVTQENLLSDLRGGTGISRGKVRITDMSGRSAVLDFSDAVTLDDVVRKINTTVDINVKASIVNDRLTITDQTGSTTSELMIQDVGSTTTAADLGIAGQTMTGSLAGEMIQYLGRDTKLSVLNDGNGVARQNGADFRITHRDGSTTDVDIGDASTLGEVIDKINASAGTKLTASIAPGSKSITLTDHTTGGGSLSVTGLAGSKTAADLGIDKTGSGPTLSGDAVLSRLGTVLLKTLNGGSGLDLGTIRIQNRSGGTTNINFTGVLTLQTVLDQINSSGAGIKAEINSAGNGIQITDTTGGSGDLIISDVSGTGAAQLGIAGTFSPTTMVVKGANLQRKWVSQATALATYNGGKGVASGRFTIQAADGTTRTISLDSRVDLRMENVIDKINAAFGGKVVASINPKGDGLMLTDSSGGAGKLTVKDLNSTTAQDLGILGTATGTTLDGSREKTITIDADDTLADVQTKINGLGYGVTAQILNDGTGANPYRLSLNTIASGRAGRVTFDSGTTGLETRTLVQAQDAAVFVGSSDTQQPLLITSSRNQISGIIRGVNIDLQGVSKEPVTVNVSHNVDNVTQELNGFVEKFNELVDKISEYTKFNSETLERGVLLGDLSIAQVEREMYAMINTVVPQAGKYRILADVGLRVGEGGKLEFDEEKFNQAYADDPESVETLFTHTGDTIAETTRLSLLNRGQGVQTAGDGVADFRATLRDGSTVDVSIGQVTTLGQLVSAINATDNARLRAEITDDGRIKLTDLTAGSGTFSVSQLNASQLLFDLGLNVTSTDGEIQGKQLKIDNAINNITGGIGVTMQQKINKLIDPINGIVTRQNKTLDSRTDQFKDRIKALDDQLQAKRERLERQFAGLESSLAKLQTQQQSLGSIQQINYSPKS